MPVICVTLAVLNEVLSLNAQESHLKPRRFTKVTSSMKS